MSRTLRSKPRLDYRKMDQSGLAAAGDKSDKVSPKDIKKGSVGTPKDAKDGKGVHKDSKASGVGAAKDPGVVHKDSKASGVGTAKDTGVVSKAGGAGAAKVTVAELLASSTPGAKAKLFPVDNESDADEEMIAIQAKMKQLDDEERRLNKSQKLREMKEELKLKQQKVKTLRGKAKLTSSVVNESGSESGNDSDTITIDKLRKNKHLKSKVDKLMKQFALNDNEDTCSSSDDTSVSDGSYFKSDKSDKEEEKKKKRKKKKKVKSGINAKAADRVKHPQRWPQAYLQFEFVSKQLKYDDLDFKQFIAGELGIISEDDISEVEKQGRIDFLKKIVYYSAMYEFKGLKAYYAAFIRDIERGRKKWSDDPSYIESAMLNKYLLKGKDYQHTRKASYPSKIDEKAERVWFCGEYQRNKCSHKSSHLKVVKGEQRLAMHICASCWLKDKKKLEHPESSTACPHLAA